MPQLFGETNPKAKLTREDVLDIRAVYAQTQMTLAEIADRFGVSVSCIHAIVKGRTWSWLK